MRLGWRAGHRQQAGPVRIAMRLTAREHPDAVQRYAHVRPAWPWMRRCGRTCPGTSLACTLLAGHRGPHVAHGSRRRVAAVWEMAEGATPSKPTARRAARTRPIGLRERSPVDVLTAARRVWLRLASMGEEIALGAFFLAFVWFAIGWLRLIFR